MKEQKQITKEIEQLMIDFASTLLYMKNDDWHHRQELDEKYAKESIVWFLKNRNITVKD